MDKLPDNIIPIEILRIERRRNKRCICLKPKYLLNSATREVHCEKCGAKVDPFDALMGIARDVERWNEEVQRLLEQRKELLNWRPWLVALREVEKVYRGDNMLPCCPHCGRGILAEELSRASISKTHELERRKFEGGGSSV